MIQAVSRGFPCGSSRARRVVGALVAFALVLCCAGPPAHQGPVAWWTFDEPGPAVARDRAGGVNDTIAGNWWRREGVSGAGLKFDDYTTRIGLSAGAYTPGAPEIPPRILPSGPAGPGKFGAYCGAWRATGCRIWV